MPRASQPALRIAQFVQGRQRLRVAEHVVKRFWPALAHDRVAKELALLVLAELRDPPAWLSRTGLSEGASGAGGERQRSSA